MDLIQTKQTRAAREQRNKYKPRTEQEQRLPIRHAGRPADFLRKGVLPIVFNPFCMLFLMVPGS